MNLNLDINSQQVTDMATFLNSDKYTAMARIAGQDMGITEAEMPIYMDLFKDHMNRRFGAIDSIKCALNGVIMNPTLVTELIKNHQQK